MSNPFDFGGSIIYEVGDFVCFDKGKYFGQEGIIESVTEKMCCVRIAPHSPDGLKLVRVMPTSLRHFNSEENGRVPDWNWSELSKVLKTFPKDD